MDNFDTNLIAKEKPLSVVLGDPATYFVIPDYQRPYSWGPDQVDQLWDDLLTWLDANPHVRAAELPPYFLGSVVLSRGSKADTWEVIDGQQRLSTLTILLTVIQRALPDFRTSLQPYLFVEGNLLLDVPPRLRLTARQRDAEFWEKRVVRFDGDFATAKDDGEVDEPRLHMLANARNLAGKFAELPADRQKRLAQALLARCYLVEVRTRDLGAAMRIFQVMNARGLDLRPTDVLKAVFLGGLPESERRDWTLRWEEAESDLGRDGLETLFTHIRMLLRRKRLDKALIVEMEAEIKARGVRPILDNYLRPAIPHYRILRECEYESSVGAERVNDHLTALNLIDNKDWEPLALLLLRELSGNAAALADALRDLEARAYWSLLRRDTVHTRETRTIELLGTFDTAGVTGLRASVRLAAAEVAELRTALDGDLYNHVRARRPVLLLLNRLVNDAGQWMIHDNVTVEHVLPQNPSDGSPWWDWYAKDAHAKWLNRLGNLLLLSRRRNTAASNRGFAEKKAKYFLSKGTTPYPLTAQVLAEKDWTETTLARRQADLTARLCARWNL